VVGVAHQPIEFLPQGRALCLSRLCPFSFLERHAPGGSAFGEENLRRVSTLLQGTQLPGVVPLADLVTTGGLDQRQSVMVERCLQQV